MRPLSPHGVSVVLVVAVGMVAGRAARAEEPVGTEFTYQGRLKQAGAPLTGTPNLQFSLWDADTGGAQIGATQALLSHPVANGLFTAPLDFAAGAFDGRARWLQIAVDGTTLTPRQKLTATPYALCALQALQADAVPWAGITGVPLDLLDGDDDTTYTAGPGLSLAATAFSLDTAYADARYYTQTALSTSGGAHVHWDNLTDVPAGFADGTDNDSGGDITSVIAGDGLTGGGEAADVRLDVRGGLGIAVDADTVSLGATYLDGSAYDDRFVNEGQADSVTLAMIVPPLLSSLDGVTHDGGNIDLVAGPGIAITPDDTANTITIEATGGVGPFWSLGGNAGTDPTVNFLGTTDSQPLELRVNSLRALRLEPDPTCPNFVGGHADNTVEPGVAGATIGGGGGSGALKNRVAEDYGTIGGGFTNVVAVASGTIGGGELNSISGAWGTVGGGYHNIAQGQYSTVGGGRSNFAAQASATIAGGDDNLAGGRYATISGGLSNAASGDFPTVSGGNGNDASDHGSTVGGGEYNTAGAFATIGGGTTNNASGAAAVIGGGDSNAAGHYATVGGGKGNTVSGAEATIGGGWANTASGQVATVGGGAGNKAIGYGTTIAGGNNNATIGPGGNFGQYATVGGGSSNTASAFYATVPGGSGNTAAGSCSFAAGFRANANHDGSFVWSDSRTTTDFESQRDHQFRVRAYGGSRFEDGSTLWVELSYLTTKVIDTSTGAYLSLTGQWTNTSDANRKENFAPVDVRDVLRRVVALPVTTWNHKAEDPSIRHMGAMAQDFHAAFGLGSDDKTIGTLDADGVALAAIQGLHQIVKEKDAEIADLKARLAKLEALMQQLAEQQAAGAE